LPLVPGEPGGFGGRKWALSIPARGSRDGAPSALGLGVKIWIFVCALTPRSLGFSVLDSGVDICPPGEGACACAPAVVSNSATNSKNSKQRREVTSLSLMNPLILVLDRPVTVVD
jgi:hypothetical protein